MTDKIKLSQHQMGTINDIHNFWRYDKKFERTVNKKTGKSQVKLVGQVKREATNFEKQEHLANLYANNYINVLGEKLSLLEVLVLYYGSKEPDIQPNENYRDKD